MFASSRTALTGLSSLLYSTPSAMASVLPVSSAAVTSQTLRRMAIKSPRLRIARHAGLSLTAAQCAFYSATPVTTTETHPTYKSTAATAVEHAIATRRIPCGAWDSHMHIIDPQLYSLTPDAVYSPSTFSLHDAITFESSIGINNVVLVQPSIYGFDNSCLLDALRRLGPNRARAVVAFDPNVTSKTQLREWHRLGVRGVRFNIKSVGAHISPKRLEQILQQYANAVRHLDWVLQLYVPMSYMPVLESIVPALNVRVCVDHLGHPDIERRSDQDPYQMAGFASLIRLLESSNTYVKLSAPYRMSQLKGYRDLEPYAREIIRLKGSTRVVFGSDWPHTRFEGLDIRPWINTVFDWCSNDQHLVDRLFRGNAEDLWSVSTNE